MTEKRVATRKDAGVRVTGRAAQARATGVPPPAGPVTTRRVSAEEAHDWRPNAKPLTLTEITAGAVPTAVPSK
jgi:hypothetical protein